MCCKQNEWVGRERAVKGMKEHSQEVTRSPFTPPEAKVCLYTPPTGRGELSPYRPSAFRPLEGKRGVDPRVEGVCESECATVRWRGELHSREVVRCWTGGEEGVCGEWWVSP